MVPRNLLMALIGPSSPSAPTTYAALGMAVVIVDGQGSTGRSRDLLHSIFVRLHINGLDDHVAAIRQIARRNPQMHLGPVWVIGRSHGGFSNFLAMLAFPDAASRSMRSAAEQPRACLGAVQMEVSIRESKVPRSRSSCAALAISSRPPPTASRTLAAPFAKLHHDA